MKRKLKSILILMFAFVFMSLSFSNAKIVKATSFDDAVIGTQNLNNTRDNSAKLGDTLHMPEKGWKRYDSANSNFTYENRTGVIAPNTLYNNSMTYGEDMRIKFKFLGSKIRYIGSNQYSGMLGTHKIIIDGKSYTFNAKGNEMYESLYFELRNLGFKEHTVEIIGDTNGYEGSNKGYTLYFNALDIDENGKLIVEEKESISLDKTSINLPEGSSEKLTATVLPENAANKKVIWSSSDESIAKVDENGNVTAIKEGQAIITAKLENTDLTATCEVNVSKLIEENKNNAILSISLVNGAIKEYDVNMEEVNKFINWFEERANGKGSATYSFNKKLNPYKSVKEYIVHDKIASFEVREYEISK